MKNPLASLRGRFRFRAGTPLALASIAAVSALVCAAPPARAQSTAYYPKQATEAQRTQLTNQAAGYVDVTVGSDGFRGSAAVARHPQLLFSAAHLLWEDGAWVTAPNIEFHRLLHQETPPGSGGDSPRGYLYFSNYSSTASGGTETVAAFDLDFVILYGNSSFGPAAPYYTTNGGEMLQSARLKKIVGYPAVIDAWDEEDEAYEGHFYQHNTDPFSIKGFKPSNRERLHSFNKVSTGGGNSGGPVYVRNDSGTYGVAGILVSGNDTSAGIHALDAAIYSMGSDALARVGIDVRVENSFQVRKRFRIPTGKKKYRPRKVRAKGFVGHVHKLEIDALFINRGRKPLQAYLQAPSGRTKFVARGKKAKRRKVKISKNLSGKFRFAQANGAWRLYMRDKKEGGKKVVFKRFSLTISD